MKFARSSSVENPKSFGDRLYDRWVEASRDAGAVLNPNSFYYNVLVDEPEFALSRSGWTHYVEKYLKDGRASHDTEFNVWTLRDVVFLEWTPDNSASKLLDQLQEEANRRGLKVTWRA